MSINKFFPFFTLIATLAMFANLPAQAQTAVHAAQKGVALVIGNSGYVNASLLPNAANDAKAVAVAMTDLAFDVTLVTNQTSTSLKAMVDAFINKVRDADIVFIFYAGHAIQLGGLNYLMPIDAPLDGPFNKLLVPIGEIVQRIEEAASPEAAKIIILDACRENPWNAVIAAQTGQVTRGLVRLDAKTAAPKGGSGENLPTGYFRIVAFATAPGTVAADGAGDHSPWTTSFLRFVRQQGVEVSEMFRLIAADVVKETNGRQRPEYLVQTSLPLFFQAVYVTDCDRLAIEGQNFLGVEGVPFDDIVAKKAVPTCEAAVKDKPNSPRLRNNLARAYERAERLQDALTQYTLAADAGYPPAINALGIMYLSGCGLPAPDIAKGVELLTRARELGNLSARAGLTGVDLYRALQGDAMKTLQQRLKMAGAYSGAVDGKPSAAVETAIENYQEVRNLARKGLTLETIRELNLFDIVPRKFRCH